MQNLGKSALRYEGQLSPSTEVKRADADVRSVAKNTLKRYSDVQLMVREATSNDPWGPSALQMSEISNLTYNETDFVEIIQTLEKRLDDKGRNWRHTFKALTLLDYMLQAGSDSVVAYFRENLFLVKTLQEFQYVDEHGMDQGQNVRQKAKEISRLFVDEQRLRDARRFRANLPGRRDTDSDGRNWKPRRSQTAPAAVPRGMNSFEAAIAASKLSAQDESLRKRPNQIEGSALEEAIRKSREEDEQHRRELGSQPEVSLFDELQPSNNGGTVTSVQWQRPTGTPLQSYNPYAAQYQQLQQAELLHSNQMIELQRQADQQATYQSMLHQHQLAQQQEYIRQQHLSPPISPPQPLVPQPTSRNPFAMLGTSPCSPPTTIGGSSRPMTSAQTQEFHIIPEFDPPPASPPQLQVPRDADKHTHLASLLAEGRDGGGVDTFGNVGNLRVPAGAQFAHTTSFGGRGAQPNPFRRQTQ